MSAAAVRELLAARFPDALPAAQRQWSAVPSGLHSLDRLFPSGGFQRGRISSWRPALGAGALLRSAALHTIVNGERAVWIDGERTDPGAWWPAALPRVVSESETAAARAAEELARSGGFALVVLDGLALETTTLVRLSRAVHEGGSALVLLSPTAALATLRIGCRPLVHEYTWRPAAPGDAPDVQAVRVQVEARASGWLRHGTVALPVRHDDDVSLSFGTGRADRRGER